MEGLRLLARAFRRVAREIDKILLGWAQPTAHALTRAQFVARVYGLRVSPPGSSHGVWQMRARAYVAQRDLNSASQAALGIYLHGAQIRLPLRVRRSDEIPFPEELAKRAGAWGGYG